MGQAVAAVDGASSSGLRLDDYAVSYVIDPFEDLREDYRLNIYQDQGELSLSLSDDSLFGDTSLLLDYTVAQMEHWGGFASFGARINRPYLCSDATHLSFYYKVLEAQSAPGTVTFRVNLRDDSDCDPTIQDCDDPNNWEAYFR